MTGVCDDGERDDRTDGMKLFSHRSRPVHLGPYPLERLARTQRSAGGHGADRPRERRSAGAFAATAAYQPYLDLCDGSRHGDLAPPAPLPHDPTALAEHLKAGLYFLDADMVGCGPVADDAWVSEPQQHRRCVVVLVAHTREFDSPQPGDEWIDGTRQRNADLRAAELAVITAAYLRNLGIDATAHTPTATDVDLERLALDGGLVEMVDGTLRAPFLSGGYGLAAVTTDADLVVDRPLARRSGFGRRRSAAGLRHLIGWGGTRPGWSRLNGDRRPLHLGSYPMERIERVAAPTTMIIDGEVPRVPVRAGGFPRAANGDLGPKFQRDVRVFAYKTPQAQSYVRQIRGMVPMQDGPVADHFAPGTDDPGRNADAVKALAHHLGGDMVGVCRIPTYAWYSHRGDGNEIEPYHANAIVILVDQGFETMEGASGDDWVSGAQSMRAYMRGGQIAGIVADHLRSLGWSARSQTNADSDVLHIPLVLHAGLGEMSRIGELVLNPFVGPRFKSVVVTTDLPLTADQPIDFGLQDFCSQCTKCARECPCAAIPFGGKIMFNGAEMWKPDVEKCTKYRLGNLKGAACGRCMKTCPFNAEGILTERMALWSAIHLPFTRPWIAKLDDRFRRGAINPVKKWWFDLEWKDERTVVPEHGTNARDLDLDGGRVAARQQIAIYPADVLPPGDAIGVPVKLQRKEAIERFKRAESPDAARSRVTSRVSGGGRRRP